MIFEIISGGEKLTGWGKNGPAYFFPGERMGLPILSPGKKLTGGKFRPVTPASNLGYLASPRTIFHGCQIVHWDPLDGKRRCSQKIFGLGYVKLHGFYASP